MRDLLVGLVGGLLIAFAAWISSKRRASHHTQQAIDKAIDKHEQVITEVEEVLDGPTPEEDLANMINEKLNG